MSMRHAEASWPPDCDRATIWLDQPALVQRGSAEIRRLECAGQAGHRQYDRQARAIGQIVGVVQP
jgi:hypothetical protein